MGIHTWTAGDPMGIHGDNDGCLRRLRWATFFYLLRTLGFAVEDVNLQNHLNTDAQMFYCESILNGVISWTETGFSNACFLVYPETADRKRIARAKEIMQAEMGKLVQTYPTTN
ncbi:hypothetical protein OSTOST_12061, partial [Ostertagia ostertagi]